MRLLNSYLYRWLCNWGDHHYFECLMGGASFALILTSNFDSRYWTVFPVVRARCPHRPKFCQISAPGAALFLQTPTTLNLAHFQLKTKRAYLASPFARAVVISFDFFQILSSPTLPISDRRSHRHHPKEGSQVFVLILTLRMWLSVSQTKSGTGDQFRQFGFGAETKKCRINNCIIARAIVSIEYQIKPNKSNLSLLKSC